MCCSLSLSLSHTHTHTYTHTHTHTHTVAIEKIAHKLFDQFIEQMQAKVRIPPYHIQSYPHSVIPHTACSHTPYHIQSYPHSPFPQTATQECAHELESLLQLLLFRFNHIRGRIKQLADRFISKLVDK